MINKFVNITFFNKLLTYLVALLPLILISGPFFSDLLISLSSIIFLLIIISKKKYKYFNNLFTYIFLSLCAYYILRSILSENIYLSLESSLFYFRFGIFSILIFYLLDNEKSFKNLFLYSLLFAFFILVVDGFIQYLFGYNLIGLPYESNRISSFFGEEKILGSYLSRLFPILVALVFISDLSHKMKITLIILNFIFSDVLVYLSGERTAFTYLICSSILFILLLNKFILSRIIALSFSLLIIFIITINSPDVKNRMINKTINQINLSTILSKNENLNQDRPFIFSIQHEVLYVSSFRIFKDNILFGVGPKMFREICKKEQYQVKTDLDKSIDGCQTSPHNYYLQLLSETGVVGSFPIILFFLYIVFVFIKHMYLKFILKKIYLSNFQIGLYIAIFITLFPFSPTGNFFNNYISIIHFIPLGFLIYSYKKDTV